ncbi:MAG: hypothetical protein EA394_06785 [Bacteroidia bacterium]|nr:MAG: hypothetical protein EA394_06785 [Bacteroidia bacterium]
MFSWDAHTQIRRLRLLALAAGFVLVLLHQLGGTINPVIDYAFFALFVILVGIPHGALDHLVEERSLLGQQKDFSMIRFLVRYIAIILAYAILWFITPVLSLLVFLLISAWHFGESDMQPAPRHGLWKITQMFMGSLVLFFILMREPLYTGDLIARITPGSMLAVNTWQWAASHAAIIYGALAAALLLAGFSAERVQPRRWRLSKWIHFSMVLGLAYFLPLLPAFALYFGGWHALNTFGHISGFLDHKKSLWSLWKSSLPFTLLSVIFLTAIGLIWSGLFSHIDPLPILFVFIAVITLPHLLVMQKMFSR